MKLINSQKNNAAKKQEQEQYPKVKTFSRAYAFSPSSPEPTETQSSQAPSFRLDERPYPLVTPSYDAGNALSEPERIDLQDTLLTDESFAERPPKHRPVAADTVSAETPSDVKNSEEHKEPEEYIEAPHYFTAVKGMDPEESGETVEDDEYDEEDEPVYSFSETEDADEEESDSFYEPESDAEFGTDQFFGSGQKTGFDPDSFCSPDFESEPDSFFTERSESGNDIELTGDSGFFPEEEAGSGFSGIDQLFPLLETDGKTTLTGSWQPLEDADGYDVFFTSGGDSYDGIYRTLSPEKTKLSFKHLKKKTVYKMRVSAFILSAGQKSYICESDNVHCITGGSTKKHTNAAEVRISSPSLDLSVGDKKRIAVSLAGQDPHKDVLPCGELLRFLSEDTSVAVVSREGKVRAVAPGSCRVFVIAPNGIRSSVNVSVRESAETVAFRKKKYSVRVGRTINLKKKLKAAPDKEKGSLKWKSSDKAVAEVSRKGIVTALKKGRITVRVKSKAGSRAKVRIRISPAKKPVVYPWESFGTGKKSVSGGKWSSFT